MLVHNHERPIAGDILKGLGMKKMRRRIMTGPRPEGATTEALQIEEKRQNREDQKRGRI